MGRVQEWKNLFTDVEGGRLGLVLTVLMPLNIWRR